MSINTVDNGEASFDYEATPETEETALSTDSDLLSTSNDKAMVDPESAADKTAVKNITAPRSIWNDEANVKVNPKYMTEVPS